MTKTKPGILTTEFWSTVAVAVTGILVTLGYLQPEQADQFVQAVVSIVGGLLTLGSLCMYIYGRIQLKQTEMQGSSPMNTLLEGLPDVEVTPEDLKYVQ